MPMNRAPFAYFGGKLRILPNLQRYVDSCKPNIDCYVEPFFGSGTLLFNTARIGEVEVVNDYSSFIYNFYKTLREDYDSLLHWINHTPYSKETFLEARALLSGGGKEISNSHIRITKKDRVRYAWAIYLIYSMSIYRGGRSFSRDSTDFSKARQWQGNTKRLEYCADRLKNATIENEDALETCKRYDGPRTFVYLDPPYWGVKNPRSMKMAYHGNDGSSKKESAEEFHSRLLDWALAAKSMVMISNYPSDLYNEALKGWNREEIEVKTVTIRGARRTNIVQSAFEVIWTNKKIKVSNQLTFI